MWFLPTAFAYFSSCMVWRCLLICADIRRTPAFEVRPRDEIRVHCIYESMTRTTTTYYGEATADEMCFGFLSYYPAVPKFTYCGQWRSVDECSNEAGYICDFEKAEPLWGTLEYVCAKGCSSACIEVLNHVNTTGCMSGDAGKYLLESYPELQQVVYLQQLCDPDSPPVPICDLEKAEPLWETLQYVCAKGCSSACIEVLNHVNTTGCMSGDAGKYLLESYPELQQVIYLQQLCAAAVSPPESHTTAQVPMPTDATASNQFALKPLWPATLLAMTMSLVIHFV